MIESSNPKYRNLAMILQAVDTAGEATASVLAEQTGLSAATISRGLATLKSQKLLIQRRKDSTEVGRRPEVFCINGACGYCLYFCLDSEAGILRGHLLDLNGKPICTAERSAGPEDRGAQLLEKMRQLQQELVRQKKRAEGKILAICISVPGLVETSGVVSRIPNFPYLENYRLADEVQAVFGLPCFVYNISRLMAVGEFLHHKGQLQNLVYIDITGDFGIGAGIILGGTLYEDRSSMAGEIGEMIIHAEAGSLVSGRNMGSLEEIAGLRTVYAEIQALLDAGHAKELRRIMEEKQETALSISLLEKAVQALDLDVYEVLNRTTKAWAAAIVNTMALLAPELVVVGGAVNENNRILSKMVRHHVGRMYYRPVQLQFAKRDVDAHISGAAQLTHPYLFERILEPCLEE